MSFKLLLLQLGCTFSTAADKLRFILSDSQCLRAFNRGFPLFFLGLFLLQNARKSSDKWIFMSSDIYKTYHDNVRVKDK